MTGHDVRIGGGGGGDSIAAAAGPRRGRPAVSAVFVAYLQLANFVAAATCGATDPFRRPSPAAHAVDLTELKRNIITGLKLEKLPDMTKVLGRDTILNYYIVVYLKII